MSSTTTNNARNDVAPIPLIDKPSHTHAPVPAGSPDDKPEAGPGGASKTACIRTFGCQMNVHDSDRMRRMILDAGYAEVGAYEHARASRNRGRAHSLRHHNDRLQLPV